MRKTVSLGLLGALAVVSLGLVVPASPAVDTADPGPNRAAGTWFNQLWIDGMPGLVITNITTFGNDGTMIACDSSDFGLGGSTPGFDSQMQGIWTRTGPFAKRGVILYMSFDPAGTHTFNVRGTFEVQGDPSDPHNLATGTWTNEIFLASQNPLTATPIQVTTGTMTGQRMQID